MRLKLYLSTALLAGGAWSHPMYGRHAVFNVSRSWWARILALPKPRTKGARRVAEAQSSLVVKKLVTVERRAGTEPVVRLLSADGREKAWSRPTAPYVSIPLTLWSNHWLWVLRAKDLAVLIALLDLQGGHGSVERPEPQWMDSERRSSYGLSPDTWRLASGRLERLGLLTCDLPPEGVGYGFGSERRRKTYWLHHEAFQRNALSVVADAVDEEGGR